MTKNGFLCANGSLINHRRCSARIMIMNYTFLRSCSRPCARWRAGSPERDERTPQNPPTPCHVASARQHPENQVGSSSERAVEGHL